MNIALINTVFIFLVGIFGTMLAFWVFIANKKNKINQFFLLFSIAMILYLVFGYLSNMPSQLQLATLWKRLFFAAITLFLIFTYFFSSYFPRKGKVISLIDKIIVATEVIFFFSILFTDFFVKNISVQPWGTDVVWGLGRNAWFITIVIFTVLIVGQIVQKYFVISKEERPQVLYFMIGILLFAGANLFSNMLFPFFLNTFKYHAIGDYSTIFLLGLTGYAIMKHQLFNIKVIATESTVIILSIALFGEIIISNNVTEGALKAIVWIVATFGGYQLVRSVKREIEQKEKIEKLADDLEKANKHLKEVDELKDDFLSMASHELNTPIAAIEGYLSMILDEKMAGEIPEKAQQYLRSVQTSSKRLALMVKELLNVSRIESNRIHLVYEEKQIENVIDQCITEVMSKVREAKHELTFEKPSKPMPITYFDVTRVTEVIINILGNAIKYTPEGGKITVKVHNDDSKIVVSVEDNGKGVPKDKGNRIFQKFSQVDILHDQVKGTGLGMYISKKFIELHKGKIWFHSDGENKGTTFFFSLPVLKQKPFDPHEGEGLVLH